MLRKGKPSTLLVGMQSGAATVENSVVFPQKNKNGTALWPSDSTSGSISKETQNTDWKEYKHPYVHCSIIYNCQDLEAAEVPISRWVDKKDVAHLCNGIVLSHKKERNLPFCDSIDRPRERYAKWNKPVRERLVPYDFIYIWNLKNNRNKQNRSGFMDINRKQTVGLQRGGGWRSE